MHRFILPIRYALTTHRFVIGDKLTCIGCRKTYPVTEADVDTIALFSGYRAEKNGDWNKGTLTFDEGKFEFMHPDFAELMKEDCGIYDGDEMDFRPLEH